ncbi:MULTISPECIES: fatty acid desaturase [unclassified Pseudodesulfovibrio]|uniref:fatty acid desaturase n=1 Tax=unclassified Pseudodesulfovibrio TaxID=2661612 RepID=UPI000FEBA603|nr:MULTISPECIES: fatty acid desaturase [unclassified Pseudodesulfovibrio]MCJ2165661.1 fatty acid desaturase [Pseudodesulfovibrio sp. S3-i]RWU02927.1 fatty acid desaturase [Pseudodesulfovibrio sp. S3]
MRDTNALSIQSLRTSLKPYAKPDVVRAVWQVVNTFLPYFGLWGLLVYLLKNGASVLVICPLLVLAALLLVRIFIIFHDCAHGSFFASRRANVILGYVSGFLTFTPFAYWQRHHLVHHGTYANLDKRGVGDLWTLTVNEYRALSPLKRLAYVLYRNPFVFLGIGPGYSFLVTQRFLSRTEGKPERFSAMITNAAIVAIISVASLTIGFKTYLMIQLPIMLVAGAVGVWLFYVQHQFEGVYWAHQDEWDPVKAAMDGSSYYKLPKVLQWFTGNIGLHHVHHVLPRIPNYRLQESYDATPAMQKVAPLTLRKSMGSLRLNLWDEERQKLVSFKSLRG